MKCGAVIAGLRAYVQEWVEATLPTDTFETVIRGFATIPSVPTA